MEYLVSILTRKTVIDLIYLVGCNYNYNSPLKNRVRLNLGNYTDTELAAIWFKNFGEVVIVGDSKFHHLISWWSCPYKTGHSAFATSRINSLGDFSFNPLWG